eukprot:m.790709 g.790709  ORF g.790709 m.790709 type:complete len:135 (+) comp59204_c0_seq4:43-447(+)
MPRAWPFAATTSGLGLATNSKPTPSPAAAALSHENGTSGRRAGEAVRVDLDMSLDVARGDERNRATFSGPRVLDSSGHQLDIHFDYLKHVVLKYMQSRSTESKHLLRVIATLLRFTPDEEAAIRASQSSRSWFG